MVPAVVDVVVGMGSVQLDSTFAQKVVQILHAEKELAQDGGRPLTQRQAKMQICEFVGAGGSARVSHSNEKRRTVPPMLFKQAEAGHVADPF